MVPEIGTFFPCESFIVSAEIGIVFGVRGLSELAGTEGEST